MTENINTIKLPQETVDKIIEEIKDNHPKLWVNLKEKEMQQEGLGDLGREIILIAKRMFPELSSSQRLRIILPVRKAVRIEANLPI